MNSSIPLQEAQRLANTHYENFPVSPFFLPKKLRQPIALIYAFARQADDLADEGQATQEQRLNALNDMRDQLPKGAQAAKTPFFAQLNAMIEQHQLPVQGFHDLLDAFSQDVVKDTYQTFQEVLEYCQKSANPVGRLVLHLTHEACEQNLKDSDSICTALQLINFLQDWYQDWVDRKRIYIPQEDIDKHKVCFKTLNPSVHCTSLKALLDEQWARGYHYLAKGFPLSQRLRGRIGFEIRLTVQGGWHVLKKLQHRNNLFERPTLSTKDWVLMTIHAAFKTNNLYVS